MKTLWWSYLLGYAFSAVVGHLLVYSLMRVLWNTLGYRKGSKEDVPHREQPMMVGVMERALYTGSWQFGKPEFIAVWLALKVGGQWFWPEPRKAGEREIIGRNVYNVFLLGSGFSIAYGVIGALLIEWINKGLMSPAVLVPIVLIVVTLGFRAWAKKFE